MRSPRGLAFSALILLAGLGAACSSGQDKAGQGSLSLRIAASRAAAPGSGSALLPGPTEPLALLRSADVTISGLEARRGDGSWIPVESGFPKVLDLLALANVGDTISFPSVLLSEGHYTAIQVRIADIILTRLDGSHVDLAPYGPGWTVLVAADFDVTTDGATRVGVNFALDRSLTLHDKDFEFDPVLDLDGVERK